MRKIILLSTLFISFSAFGANGHEQNMFSRSFNSSNLYLQQKIAVEQASLIYKDVDKDQEVKMSGYGLDTAIGMEAGNFVRLSLHHTFSDTKNNQNALFSLRGSRFSAQASLLFTAPLFNVTAGGGLSAANYDFQNQLEQASYTGVSKFAEIGLESFISPRLSLNFDWKVSDERLSNKSGNLSTFNEGGTRTLYDYALGCSVWL